MRGGRDSRSCEGNDEIRALLGTNGGVLLDAYTHKRDVLYITDMSISGNTPSRALHHAPDVDKPRPRPAHKKASNMSVSTHAARKPRKHARHETCTARARCREERQWVGVACVRFRCTVLPISADS